MNGIAPLALTLPADAEVLELAFVDSPSIDANIWLESPDLRGKVIVVRRCDSAALAGVTAPDHLLLVTIPAAGESDLERVRQLQESCERTGTPVNAQVRSVLLSLHGAHIVWQPHLIIVVAAAERLPVVCRAAVQATCAELELRSIERALDSRWETVTADSRLAFEFTERDVAKKPELADRFQQTIALRMRLERLTPQALVPHVHPPTLASQIGERLRERLRMAERLELADGKLEAQERIYELCSQRTSEFMVARTGHMLEWVIIILLLSQTMLLVIEFLTSRSAAS